MSWNQLRRRGCFLGKQKQRCQRDAGGAAGPSVQCKESQPGTHSPHLCHPLACAPSVSLHPQYKDGSTHWWPSHWEGGDERSHNGKGAVQPSSLQAAQEGAGGLSRASKHHQMWPHPTPRPTRGVLSLGWGSLSPSGSIRGEGKKQRKIAALNGVEPRRLQRDFDSPIITPN